jgi:hypothetical protein
VSCSRSTADGASSRLPGARFGSSWIAPVFGAKGLRKRDWKAWISGGLRPRARYKFEGNIAAKHRASEVEMHPGALRTCPPDNLSRTYALPASTTATESNLKNRPRRTAVHPPCDMPRSGPVSARGNCDNDTTVPRWQSRASLPALERLLAMAEDLSPAGAWRRVLAALPWQERSD